MSYRVKVILGNLKLDPLAFDWFCNRVYDYMRLWSLYGMEKKYCINAGTLWNGYIKNLIFQQKTLLNKQIKT
jgi:hypothetical protein